MTEHTPLLGDPLLDEANAPSVLPGQKLHHGSELKLLSRTTLPIAVSFALTNIVQAISIYVVGRRGTFELGVASYGYMFASVTGGMIAAGGSTAIDTLCSQAITSPGYHPHMLGQHLQRGIFILSGLFIVVMLPLWWFSGYLFLALGQEYEFAMQTCYFLRVFLPGGLIQVVAECLKKFLQVQGHSHAVSRTVALASGIGIAANFLLITPSVANMGLLGAPLAHTIYHLSTVVGLLLFSSSREDIRQCWGGFTRGKLREWTRFTKLAIPGIVTVVTEGMVFESVAIMAATLPESSIGAQGIIMTSDIILYTLPAGLGVAASHRIGNLLGANDAKGARFAIRGPYMFAAILGLIEFLLIMSVQKSYGFIFSKDKTVVHIVAQVLPLMACFQVLDLGNNGASGILRGAGKVHLAGYSNVVAYYGAGLTSAWYLCFSRDLGLFGLWLGVIIGSAVLLVFQTSFILLINWKKEAEIVSAQHHSGK